MTPSVSRILVVDDKEVNLAYLRALLTSRDYTVESAHDGAEALLKARQSPPDVVISDLLMPVMDGFTLLRQWKADERLAAIPFIVCTATYIDQEDERLALSLGADAFILKPFDPVALIARLREVQARAVSARPAPPPLAAAHDEARLTLYNETLIRKLEEKTLQLASANRALQQDIVARQQAELWQRQMADTQTAILNALPAHIALLDADGIIVTVNDAWRRFGAANVLESSALALGQNYLHVCEQAHGECADEAERVAAGIRQVLRGELPEFALDYPCHSPTEQRWFRVMVTPLGAGVSAGAVVTHINVTTQREAQQSIRMQAAMLDHIGQAVIATGTDGRIIYANRATRDVYGWTPDEILGRNVIDVTVPHVSSEQAVEIMARLQQTETWSGKFLVQHRDGRTFPAHVTDSPLLDDAGLMIGIIGISTDITAPTQAEQKVADQLAELRRWQAVMLERTDRSMELKREVNALLLRLGEPIRYPSQVPEPPQT